MKKYVAEFLGTFILTFTACGAASFTGGYQQGFLQTVGIALIFGLVLTALCYSIGNVSGCHVNPAVSIAMFAAGKMRLLEFVGYIVAQFLGGIAGGFALYGVGQSFNQETIAKYSGTSVDFLSLGTNGFGTNGGFLEINAWGAVVVEVILTFIFVYTVLGVTSKKEFANVAGIVIGMALTAVHLFGISITGTSVNPARSLGPALAKGICGGDYAALSQVWVFIAAPLLGGLLAAVAFMVLNSTKDDKMENIAESIPVDEEVSEDETDEQPVLDIAEVEK